MTQWIETHDQTLVDASAVEAINPVTRETSVRETHEVILVTANHSYVFARGFSSHDEAVKVARALIVATNPAGEGRRLVLDAEKLKIQQRYSN